MSNYDKLCEKWRQEFLQMDVEDLMKKLSELKIENDCLVLWHFGRKLGVRLEDGEIFPLKDTRPVENGTKMNIYNLFYYAI